MSEMSLDIAEKFFAQEFHEDADSTPRYSLHKNEIVGKFHKLIHQLQASHAAELAAKDKQIAAQSDWINTCKNHAPYKAAWTEWKLRAEAAQKDVEGLTAELAAARKELEKWQDYAIKQENASQDGLMLATIQEREIRQAESEITQLRERAERAERERDELREASKKGLEELHRLVMEQPEFRKTMASIQSMLAATEVEPEAERLRAMLTAAEQERDEAKDRLERWDAERERADTANQSLADLRRVLEADVSEVELADSYSGMPSGYWETLARRRGERASEALSKLDTTKQSEAVVVPEFTAQSSTRAAMHTASDLLQKDGKP